MTQQHSRHEILQVLFDTVPASHDEEDRCTPYVLISRNFEFPCSATIEWHDGQNYDDGPKIIFLTLQRDRVFIKLDRKLQIEVTFRLRDKKFANLKSLLRTMIDDRIAITE